MLNFWIVVAVMISVPIVILLRILISPKPGIYKSKAPIDVMVYKSRAEELETEIESGILNNEHLAEAHDDLKRNLLHEIEHQQSVDATNILKRDWWTAGSVTILLPVIAISIYLVLGASESINVNQEHPPIEDLESMKSVEEMVEGLAARLQNDPDNQEGWFMLAKSYMVLGKYNEALKAFDHLYKLDDSHPDILLGYANAMALTKNGRTSGTPEQLAQRVLEMDPGNSNALWIIGMAAFEQREFQHAIDNWQKIIVHLEPGSASYIELEKLIAEANLQLGEADDQIGELTTDHVSDDLRIKTITVNVSLSEKINSDINPADSLFIFARALEGPPMPIAVIKKQVSDMPLTVVLDDTAAMMAQRKLSDFEKVIVGARISRTGDAMAQPGDLTGNHVTVDLGKTESISILIDQRVP